MKILQINKFHFINGGTARYYIELSSLLKRYNHTVAFFSMKDRRSYETIWSKYFINNISYEDVSFVDVVGKFLHMIYSLEAKNKISQLLDHFKPDIAHLHSIYHHISPSIILELKKRNIPIVQTIHDYHLISPCRWLFHDGKICEISKPDKYYKTILHQCIKRSFFASAAEAIEKYIHLFLGWERNYIDYFIAPSRFMKNKLVEYGIDKDKIIHLPLFIDYHKYKAIYAKGEYILYFGRLSYEKGLNYLSKALNLLPKIKLKIVGRGQQEEELRKRNKKLENKNVQLVGFKDGVELKRIIVNSRFSILPSVWYENFPNCILESFVSGKAVVASNIGGIPESIKDGYNGYLFKPGDVENLVEKINKLWNNPSLCRKMERNAREYVEKNFGPQEHYQKLMGIYKKAIEKHK